MKARTAKERTVEALTAQYIRPLTDEQIRAAHGVARPKSYVLCPGNTKDKGLVWCTNCGHVINFRPALIVNQGARCVCDNCGATLAGTNEAMYSNHGHLSHDDSALVALAEVVGEWQVFRYFYIASTSRLGQRAWLSRPTEVVRRWYNVVRGGKEVVWSVGITGMMYGTWNFNAPLSLKSENTRPTYHGTNSYKFIPDAWIPGGTWHKALKRDGCKGETTARRLDLAPHEIVPAFTCPQIVTLVKGHHYKMARYYSGGVGNGFRELREDWTSIKVALRHGYTPRDPQVWHDLLHYLRNLHRDTLSPRWICPANLRLAHDTAERTYVRRDMAQKKEVEKKQLAKAEKKYAKHIAAFVGLELVGAGFSIAVIPTVADVKVEGERMHHCVYNMGYYAVETSLLLSARSADGRRLETIEFDLERGKVLQSRAACNKTSPKHDEILAVMAAHSADIQKMWRRSNNQPNNH